MSYSPQFHNEVDIESIISAPLIAASKANVMMATGQTRFLLEYCFEKAEGGQALKPKMIEMSLERTSLQRSEDDQESAEANTSQLSFHVPLLCLVPLNSLAVDMINVGFALEVTSVRSAASDNGIIDKKAQLNGRVGRDPAGEKQAQRSSSQLKVGINASPLPLPRGVLALIDLYEKSIMPKFAPDPEGDQ